MDLASATMERKWPNAPHRRSYRHPSFSSTLLDAVYRSMDDERDGTDSAGASLYRRAGGARDSSVPDTACKKSTAVHGPGPGRSNVEGRERVSARRRGGAGGSGFPTPISTSSSSEYSNYGMFSSSELRPNRDAAEVSAPSRSFARAHRHAPPLPPPKSAPPKMAPLPLSLAAYHQENKKAASIRSKLRSMRKTKSPASPGARVARFINSLFASAGGNRWKSKSSPAVASSAVVRESVCSTASSSYSRSYLIKTPSWRGARDSSRELSVSFYPVSVILDEKLRPCGHKIVYEEVLAAQPRPSAADGRMEREAKRRAEELLRRPENDEDEDEGGSDSSSDLFELEIEKGAGSGLGYWGELPVYETTSHHNRPISHIF